MKKESLFLWHSPAVSWDNKQPRMNRLHSVHRLLFSFALSSAALTQLVAAADDAEALFVRRIQPLFSEKCIACHGQEEVKIKGGFDMRSRESILAGGDSGEPGLVAGKPLESPLYLASTREHEDWEAMPPKETDKLYAEALGWIEIWIAGGAPWPDATRAVEITKANEAAWAAEDGIIVKTTGGLSPDWTNRRYPTEGLWGYAPLATSDFGSGISDWEKGKGEHPVDALIAKHFPVGVTPAPAADARTFIRRATFDLTGLPPTPEEIAAFEAESIPNPQSAIRNLLDRLLESPHYGERMAQHWLDVVRYADSSGFANDYERGNAWRYRDYVVRSFNTDKPYDQFIVEQIAGDELDPADPEKVIATGFLRMGPWELTGMEVAKIARQRFLDDVTNSVGEVFIAHSLQCARCHDHKFDPVPTVDYYSIQAVFATTQLVERPAPFLPNENTEGFGERAYLEKRRAEYLATLAELDRILLENAQAWFRENGKDPSGWNAAVEAIAAQGEKGGNRGFSEVFGAARNRLMKEGVAESDFPPKLVGFTPEQFGLERVARKGLERLRWEVDRYEPYALAVYNGATPQMKSVNSPLRLPKNPFAAGELEQTCILTGGDPFASGEKVKPGILSVLSSTAGLDGAVPEAPEGRRTAFAKWVAHPDNPLTTRAIVNRVWMWHFGEPLAGNPNNFGSTGKKPTHPELLDWLAATFVESGWSFKELHRTIMTSEAYRRSSGLEVSGSKLSREELEKTYAAFKPRRLSAEELRDAMLAATGELNPALGGIPNRPEINLEAAMQPRQVMGTFASAWVPNPLREERHRRSLYALKLRGQADPMMEVFNAPTPDFSCERRDASTVTPQVFALFNSRASLGRSLALATRVLRETETDEAAIDRIFALLLGRTATAAEIATCLAHWREMTPVQEKAVYPEVTPPLTVRREAVEENTGEKFSFDERLHAYADFVPDLQPGACDARTRALADVCLALLNSNEFAYVY
jgi:mono/diheme cytochrome c family protein